MTKSNSSFDEMIANIKKDTVYSVVLRSGSTHNIVSQGITEQVLLGRIALEKIAYLFDTKNQPKGEFGFCSSLQEIEYKKDINVFETFRVFISLPRTVIIPVDNIGLVEEGAFPYLESKNVLGTEILTSDQMMLHKFPHLAPYHSEIGGFYQSPVIMKKSSKTIPFKLVTNDVQEVKEANEVKEEKAETEKEK